MERRGTNKVSSNNLHFFYQLNYQKKSSHLPIMTAATVKITKAFLMKNPFTSSLVMFSTLFLASSDRDWIPARIWWRPLRLLCGFSPLLWVIIAPGNLQNLLWKCAGTWCPFSCGGNTVKMMIRLLPVALLPLCHTFVTPLVTSVLIESEGHIVRVCARYLSTENRLRKIYKHFVKLFVESDNNGL